MRLSDIIEHDVIDVEGNDVGRVHDVRVVREGPVQGMFGASYRVVGLIVGGAAVGSRLGFDRASIRGPWALKKLFGSLLMSRKYVDWAAVASVEGGVLRLTIRKDDCRNVPPLPGY